MRRTAHDRERPAWPRLVLRRADQAVAAVCLAASLVAAVAAAVLASLGLEALGLGAVDSPTIGMTIYWVIFYGAVK